MTEKKTCTNTKRWGYLMTYISLLLILIIHGCGISIGEKEKSEASNSNQSSDELDPTMEKIEDNKIPGEIYFFKNNKYITSACTGEFVTDFVASIGGGMVWRFKKGDVVYLSKIEAGDQKVYSGIIASADQLGTKTFDIDESALSVNCNGYVISTVVLQPLELYSDKQFKKSECTVATGVNIPGDLSWMSVSKKEIGHLFTVRFKKDRAPDACPSDVELYTDFAESTIIDQDNDSFPQLLFPMVRVFYAP